MSGPRFDRAAELAELRRALKETVMNLESVVEVAQRVLRRARERLDEFPPDDELDDQEP